MRLGKRGRRELYRQRSLWSVALFTARVNYNNKGRGSLPALTPDKLETEQLALMFLEAFSLGWMAMNRFWSGGSLPT
jgi:hypothetical protein